MYVAASAAVLAVCGTGTRPPLPGHSGRCAAPGEAPRGIVACVGGVVSSLLLLLQGTPNDLNLQRVTSTVCRTAEHGVPLVT